jgi:hypothetical protein
MNQEEIMRRAEILKVYINPVARSEISRKKSDFRKADFLNIFRKCGISESLSGKEAAKKSATASQMILRLKF